MKYSGTIYLGADHGGWKTKTRLVAWLKKLGLHVVDIGSVKYVTGDDYPVWTARTVRLVQRKVGSRAILVCRSGVGMSMVANKFKNIRAVQGWSAAIAKRSRQDEDTNVLSLASDYTGWVEIQKIVRAWLNTPWRPIPRYRRRLREIRQIERVGQRS